MLHSHKRNNKMVDKLKELHRDKAMTHQLLESMLEFTEATAGKRAVNGIDTAGMRDAYNLISLYFEALEAKYGEKKRAKADNPE